VAKQVTLKAEPRTELGKGPTGRLRRTGRVPGILYGYQVEPTALHVDAREFYHAMHTDAGRNVLLRVEVSGETYLAFARDLQIHPIRGEVLHADFLAVNRDVPMSVDVPVVLTGEEDVEPDGGVINQILYTVPIKVKPLEVPSNLRLDIAGMAIGDVRRVADLQASLPEAAEFEVDLEEAVLTINAPISEEELEAAEAEAAGIEEPELIGEEAEEEAAAEEGEEAAAAPEEGEEA
jgi:large subunit ribosomal protein L25